VIVLEFAQWLEEAERWGFLSWDERARNWYRSTTLLGDRPKFRVFWDESKVDVEMAGPRHPQMKRALRVLIKQRPEFAKRRLEFDGYSPGTVEEFLRSQTRPPWEMPRYFYQGTSDDRWSSIERAGLVPRAKTGVKPAYGAHISSAKPSNPNYVYLVGSPGAIARWAANDAARADQSIPVILKIDSRGMDMDKLRPDEDSRSDDWKDSLAQLDSVAYEGEIEPEFITLYRISKGGKWQDAPPPPPPKPYEPDWLAKQVMDMHAGGTGYTNIPDTTAKYKWVNPREK